MIKVIKYFTDIKDLKSYNVGEVQDFGKQRNEYLVEHGYAEWIKQKKTFEPEIKKKPNKSKK